MAHCFLVRNRRPTAFKLCYADREKQNKRPIDAGTNIKARDATNNLRLTRTGKDSTESTKYLQETKSQLSANHQSRPSPDDGMVDSMPPADLKPAQKQGSVVKKRLRGLLRKVRDRPAPNEVASDYDGINDYVVSPWKAKPTSLSRCPPQPPPRKEPPSATAPKGSRLTSDFLNAADSEVSSQFETSSSDDESGSLYETMDLPSLKSTRYPGRSTYEPITLPLSLLRVDAEEPRAGMRRSNSKPSYEAIMQPQTGVSSLLIEKQSQFLDGGSSGPVLDDHIYGDVQAPLRSSKVSTVPHVCDEPGDIYENLSVSPRYEPNCAARSDNNDLHQIAPGHHETTWRPTPAPRSFVQSRQSLGDPTPKAKGPLTGVPLPGKPRELPEVQKLLENFRQAVQNSSETDKTRLALSDQRDFVVRFLDGRGGRLQLKLHGVTLDVPPGALGDTPVEVYIYVPRRFEVAHGAGDGLTSTVVHCGVSGLKFKLPVVLHFPVGVADTSAWELTGMRQSAPGDPWEDLIRSQDAAVRIKQGLCTMVVDHFTGFGLSGRPRESSSGTGAEGTAQVFIPLRVGVFRTEGRPSKSGSLQLRLRIWDSSDETAKRIDMAERNSKLLDTTRVFYLRKDPAMSARKNSGLDVTIAIRKLNSPWLIDDDQMNQSLHLAKFTVDQSGHVDESCTFNLKLRPRHRSSSLAGGRSEPLECDFVVSQRSHEELAIIIRALDEIDVCPGTDTSDSGSPIRSPVVQSVKLHRNDTVERMDSGFVNPKSLARYDELCRYLDAEKRWKNLADGFFGRGEGSAFERCCWPSEAVLHAVFSSCSVEGDTETTLERVVAELRSCGLQGAADIVLEDMNTARTPRPMDRRGSRHDGESLRSAAPIQCESVSGHHQRRAPTADTGRGSASSGGARRGGAVPEENDEESDRIHTLRSSSPSALLGHVDRPMVSPTSSVSPPSTTRKKEPVEQTWPGTGVRPIEENPYESCLFETNAKHSVDDEEHYVNIAVHRRPAKWSYVKWNKK